MSPALLDAPPSLTGSAKVYCVHDREKRVVNDEVEVAKLGALMGIAYDPAQHKLHRCGCCLNLFVDPSDEPRYCLPCQNIATHELGGPLAAPIGVVD